jgi:hypothetical protein
MARSSDRAIFFVRTEWWVAPTTLDHMTKRPIRRTVRRIGFIALAAFVAAIIGFVVWAELPMRADPAALSLVEAQTGFSVEDDGTTVVMTPDAPTGVGLVFISGARVDAPAYEYKLSGLAQAGVTVVIVRPVLNFAIFDQRPLTDFEAAAPGVDHWYVGGHSLGGVKACMYAADGAADGTVEGLVFFGSYCANDISATGLPVLSLAGENDALSTPQKIEDAAPLLPATAEFVTIPGSNHAQFGNYGDQPGDGTSTATDADVRGTITDAVAAFVSAG